MKELEFSLQVKQVIYVTIKDDIVLQPCGPVMILWPLDTSNLMFQNT